MAEITRVFRHAHMCCGIGAGAKGFNQANPRIGHIQARFECAGGIDVDVGAVREFERQTGAKGTVLDLFNAEQYAAFHGKAPPADYREASPADVYAAFGPAIDVAFASMPCKGFSGLLSATQSKTDKYQALNGLTLRGVWLLLEAYKDEPIPIILFENVPRIASRGRWLLDQIIAILRSYGYLVNEDSHDCGEIGGLAQSRKRFLLIARHPEKIPPFVYQPPKMRLRGVGEVIGKLPLPGDPIAGVMHRVPALQWKTWVRLAFVPAGKDWRALNDLVVEAGVLRDFGIMPEQQLRDNALGVCAWDDTAPLITGARAPGQGRFSVADPRPNEMHSGGLGVVPFDGSVGTVAGETHPTNGAFSVADPRAPDDRQYAGDYLGVRKWNQPSGTVSSRGGPTNGAYSVADPRPGYGPDTHHNVLRVTSFDRPGGTVTSAGHPAAGALSVADPRCTWGADSHRNKLRVTPFEAPAGPITGSDRVGSGAACVADPRVDGHPKSVQLGVRRWDQTAACVKGDVSVGTGPYAVADPRLEGRPRFNNTFRIVPYGASSPAVAGPGGPAGGLAVADPRPAGKENYETTKYKVNRMDQPARAVIGASTTGDGAFAVADPRPEGLQDPGRAAHSYNTQAHYGVVGWDETSAAVPGFAKYDRGKWSVADPREAAIDVQPVTLPEPNDRLICRIVSLDETWHRPFTTLELGALQSIIDPEEAFGIDDDGRWFARIPFEIETSSDAQRREWIGNAVPSAAARGMATTIGETLILAGMGETFTLSTREIWVKPLALALTVDNNQVAFDIERGIA